MSQSRAGEQGPSSSEGVVAHEPQGSVERPRPHRRVRDFATLFLSLAPGQRASFLVHITRDQCEIIRSCAYNLLLNKSIEIAEEDKAYLQKRVYAVRRLASKRFCLRTKRVLLARYSRLVYRLMRIVLRYLDAEEERIAQTSDD